MNGKGLKHGLCIDLPENKDGRKDVYNGSRSDCCKLKAQIRNHSGCRFSNDRKLEVVIKLQMKMAATLKIRCVWKLSTTFNWYSAEADVQPYLSVKSKGSLLVLGPVQDELSSSTESNSRHEN